MEQAFELALDVPTVPMLQGYASHDNITSDLAYVILSTGWSLLHGCVTNVKTKIGTATNHGGAPSRVNLIFRISLLAKLLAQLRSLPSLGKCSGQFYQIPELQLNFSLSRQLAVALLHYKVRWTAARHLLSGLRNRGLPYRLA